MFCLPFEYVTGGIFQIANIVLSLVKKLNTNWQAINLQHACSSHKNIILNEKIKPTGWHPRFEVYNLNVDKTWAPTSTRHLTFKTNACAVVSQFSTGDLAALLCC